MVQKSIYIKKVSTKENFSLLQEKWNTLLAESPINNFFLRWEWLWAWWEAYKEKNYNLCILLVFRGNELIGIAPFYINYSLLVKILPIRRLMFLGTKEGSIISEYMDIIYRDGDEEVVIREVIEFITKTEVCDDICFHKIETSSRTISILQQLAKDMKFLYSVVDKAETPYISLPNNYERFLDTLSSSMRNIIRKNQRRLSKYTDVVFRKTSDISEFENDFIEFVRLHQCRWESLQFPGSFSQERFFTFQKQVMKDMIKTGHMELRFLSISGRNIAAVYNINYKNKICFYQGGLDTSFDRRLSPGILLHGYCIKEAIKDNLKEYDFLLMGNMDSYKKKWTKEYRCQCDIYIACPKIVQFVMTAKNKARGFYYAVRGYSS